MVMKILCQLLTCLCSETEGLLALTREIRAFQAIGIGWYTCCTCILLVLLRLELLMRRHLLQVRVLMWLPRSTARLLLTNSSITTTTYKNRSSIHIQEAGRLMCTRYAAILLLLLIMIIEFLHHTAGQVVELLSRLVVANSGLLGALCRILL